MAKDKTRFELSARYQKAWRLIDSIDHLVSNSAGWHPHADGFAIAHFLQTWTAEHWASCAVAAGCRPPSAETQAIVIDRYKSRAQQWEADSQRRTG